MNLIFVGPQGSGKGTQARKIAAKFGLCHISTGDLLRHVEGELKFEVDLAMSEGDLVSDELIIRILKERLMGEDCRSGFILDGFPRDVLQAKELKKIVGIDRVVEIAISDDESVRRIDGRRSCEKCNVIFNVNSNPSKVEGVCDKCGGGIVKRKDDNEVALRERLRVYHKETEKVLDMFDVVRVDGEQSIDKVFSDIVQILS